MKQASGHYPSLLNSAPNLKASSNGGNVDKEQLSKDQSSKSLSCNGERIRDDRRKSLEFKMFHSYDTNGDGEWDLGEVTRFLQRGDPSVRKDDVKELFQAMDRSGDKKIQFTELWDFLHPANGAETHPVSHFITKKLKKAFDNAGPGPSDYVGDYRQLGHQKKAPSASIGQSSGHLSINNLTDAVAAGCIVSGDKADSSSGPGPATYAVVQAKDGLRGSQQACKFGTGPGHDFVKAPKDSPGPGEYRTEASVTSSVKRVSCCKFTSAETDRDDMDGRIFSRYDRDKNGSLDIGEVSSMLRASDASIKDDEIKKLFEIMDKNSDGTIQIHELKRFLHSASTSGISETWRKKLQVAFNLSSPGPLDYTGKEKAFTATSWHRSSPAATFGKSQHNRLEGVPGLGGPGPCTYSFRPSPTKNGGVIARGPAHLTFASDAKRSTPGPAYYNKSTRSTSKDRHVASATFGTAAGHSPPSFGLAMRSRKKDLMGMTTPGPGEYNSTWQRSAAGGTIGRGPGHLGSSRNASASASGSSQTTASGPGPSDYDIAPSNRHIPGGAHFGSTARFQLPPLNPCDSTR